MFFYIYDFGFQTAEVVELQPSKCLFLVWNYTNFNIDIVYVGY